MVQLVKHLPQKHRDLNVIFRIHVKKQRLRSNLFIVIIFINLCPCLYYFIPFTYCPL